MIIKYINEGVFGSYKGKKTTKEDKLANLKKETKEIIEKSITEDFLKIVRPLVEKKYEEILYDMDPWYVNDNLRIGFVVDPKEILLELKKVDNKRISYQLIIKLPVIHLETNDLCVKPIYRDRRELQDSLSGVMREIYNYFQYDDKINKCYNDYFRELYLEEKREYGVLQTTPILHLLNHDIENYTISGIPNYEFFKLIDKLFFSWFDNYQVKCKTFLLQCERLKFKNCEEISELLKNHIICDKIILYRCNGTELESIKGLEKLLSFEKLQNREYQIEIRFVSSFTTKPGVGLRDYEKVCSEKLIQDITGKSYDDNIFEHRIASVDDPRDLTEEDLISYQVSRTKITSLMFNIDRNGIPIKDEYEVGVSTSSIF